MAAETATVKLTVPLPEAPEIRDDESFSEVARKLSLYVASSPLPSPIIIALYLHLNIPRVGRKRLAGRS